jgi:hypothetical protein
MAARKTTNGKARVAQRVVYIAHPISGDIEGNIQRVLAICKEIHLKSKNIIPMAPYVTVLQYLDDTKPRQRKLGFAANRILFERGGFDELWLCGEKISSGMKEEVEWCVELNIPVICYSANLTEELIHFRTTGKWFEED